MRARIPLRCTAALVLAAVWLLSGDALATGETPVVVQTVGRAYLPVELTVGLGQTVVWQNRSITHHTVTSTSGLFESSSIAPGGSYSETFAKAGTFDYECLIHPGMKGSVVVLDLPAGKIELRLSVRRSAGTAVTVAHVSATRSGPVLLQARGGGGWKTVARGVLDTQGEATLTLARPDHRSLRVALPAELGQPQALSGAKRSPA